MAYLKKVCSLLISIVLILSLLIGPAMAKGFKGGGFSSGGRSSFSSGAKGFSSSGGLFGSKSSGASSSTRSSASTSVGSSGTAPKSTVGGGASSYGNGYGSDTGSFSTPRQNSPPALTSDFSTNRPGYSSGTGSYSTGTGSYNGGWNRDTFKTSGMDQYPSKAPVGIFGSPPKPPYYYHNQYWGLPLMARMFFQPNYYWTPWGYHFFAPRLITWIIAIFLVGAVVILMKNRIRGSRL